MRHWPVRAGLRLQVISAAEAATGNSKITAQTALTTAHFLQRLSRRLGQEQDGDKRNRNGGQQPLDGRAMAWKRSYSMPSRVRATAPQPISIT